MSTPFPPDDLPLSQRAVVVIDMANDFISAPGVIATAGGADYQRRAQAVVPRLARLLAAARAAGVTVIYGTDQHEPGDAELRKWPPHAMKGTWEGTIADGVAPMPGDVTIPKATYSPFLNPQFEAALAERGIRQLCITGLTTDCCCRHTSGDAFQRGYDLVWVTDAMMAFTEDAHRTALDYFRAWYATDEARQFRTVDELAAAWGAVGAVA